MSVNEYDFIICGGGTAGCVLASRLKQGNPKLSIAVIERGQDEAGNPLVLNPLAVAQLRDTGLDTIYPTVPQPQLNNQRIELHAGNILSGSSAVNYGLWMRGDRIDYDQWADLAKDQRWSYQGLLEFFKRSETHYDPTGSRQQHGFDGPMKTSAGRHYPLGQPFHDGFLEIGLKFNEDQNAGNPLGFGLYTENWSPQRQPASLVYDQTGVTHITGAIVRRVILEDSNAGLVEAKGVEYSIGSEVHLLRARKEIILSCGAFRTPQVLLLSGIGSPEQLSRLDIPVRVKNPNVGKNLFDHLGCFLCFKLQPAKAEEGIALGNAKFMSNPKHLEGMAADWMGIDTIPAADVRDALQIDSRDEDSVPSSHALLKDRARFWVMSAYMPISLGQGYNVPMDGGYISVGMLNFQPTSRGTVILHSKDPNEVPIIDPQYNATHYDRYVMREGTRKVLKLTETAALAPFIVGEEPPVGKKPLDSSSSDEAIDLRVREAANTLNHGAGTAAIGKVIDSKLRVKGVKGLRVCDASVFPAPIAATLQATVYAIAESLADILLNDEKAEG